MVGLLQIPDGAGCQGERGAAAEVQISQLLWPQPQGMSYKHSIIFWLYYLIDVYCIFIQQHRTSGKKHVLSDSPSKQWYTQIQKMLICVYSVFVWMCVNICDKSSHSMMPSEWTSCMNRPSGPSCWRKLSAQRRKWWCLLPCRYREQVCLCERRERERVYSACECACVPMLWMFSLCLWGSTIESYHLFSRSLGTSPFHSLLNKPEGIRDL